MLAYHPRSIWATTRIGTLHTKAGLQKKSIAITGDQSKVPNEAVTIAISPRETLRKRKRYAWDPDTSGYATSTRRAAPSRRSGFSKNVESREGRDTYTPTCSEVRSWRRALWPGGSSTKPRKAIT